MKGKLSLLALLSTVVTVGGVYATWSFAEKEVSNANTTVNVAMTGLTASTTKGTLSVKVMGEGGFTLAVDDPDNNHMPDIMKTGVVVVTFTPSVSASEEIKTNGIDVNCVISYAPYKGGPATLEDWKYAGTQMFQITNDASAPIFLDNEQAVKEDGVFTWTIAAADVGIDLTTAFKGTLIDTLDKYDAANAELAKGHFILTVSDANG